MASVEDRKAAHNQLVSLTAVFWMSRNAPPREPKNQPDPLTFEQPLFFLLYHHLKGQCHAVCYLLKKLKLFFASIGLLFKTIYRHWNCFPWSVATLWVTTRIEKDTSRLPIISYSISNRLLTWIILCQQKRLCACCELELHAIKWNSLVIITLQEHYLHG